jgi:hypothetical protein
MIRHTLQLLGVLVFVWLDQRKTALDGDAPAPDGGR